MAKLPITPSKGLTSILKYGYNILDDLGFFSRAEKVIDLLPPKAQVGKGSDIITKIEELGGKPVKDELLFTGLKDEFIEAPRVTTQELKDYLNQNKTMMKEKVRSKEAVQKMQTEGFDDFGEARQDQIYYGTPNDTDNQGVPEWIFNEGFDIGGGETSFVQGLTTIKDLPLDTYKAQLGNIMNTDNYDVQLTDTVLFPQGPIRNNYDLSMAYSNMIQDANESTLPFIEITKEGSNIKTIGNNEVGWYTYVKDLPRRPNASDIKKSTSLNEAQLKANQLLLSFERPELKKKEYDMDIDVQPKHEQYTVGGGDNYQEIILTSKQKQDKYLSKIGDIPVDIVEKLQTARVLRDPSTHLTMISNIKQYDDIVNPKQGVTVGGNADDLLDTIEQDIGFKKEDVDKLLNVVKTIPFNRNEMDDYDILADIIKLALNGNLTKGSARTTNIELTPNGELFYTKPDYSVDTHFPEKNILVYARTKDRVDEDGGKNLATEELQSDISQQGRPTKQGMAYGTRELKQVINRKSPVVHGDFMDAYNELDEISNIGDLRFNALVTDTKAGDTKRPFRQGYVSSFFDSTKQFQDKNFNKYTIPELIKSSETKYKFHETKDETVKSLTSLGFSKMDDAPNVDQFYANKRALMPTGKMSNEILQEVKSNYENPVKGTGSTDFEVYRTFQQNKNKLYNNMQDYTAFQDFEELGNIVDGSIGVQSNKIAKKDLVFDLGDAQFNLVSYISPETAKASGRDNLLPEQFLTMNDKSSTWSKLVNEDYVYEKELNPNAKKIYDEMFALANEDSRKRGKASAIISSYKQQVRETGKDLVGKELDEANQAFNFLNTKRPKMQSLGEFFADNGMPEATKNRLNSYIDKMNNFIKRHDGMYPTIGKVYGRPFNYKDYVKEVDDNIKSMATYQGGQKDLMELKMQYDTALKYVNRILIESNDKIDAYTDNLSKNYDSILPKFNFDFGNKPPEEAFDKLKNFGIANEKLRLYKKGLTINPKKQIPSLPFVGDSKKFAEVGIKRLILKAIDGGYDTVSVLPAHVHTERWGAPELAQFYDVTIPSVVKNILKGTGQQAQIKKVFSDKNALNRYQVMKNMEDITNELAMTNKYRKIPEDRFQIDGMPVGENERAILENSNKRSFLEDVLQSNREDVFTDIKQLHKDKFGQTIDNLDIESRLRVLAGMTRAGIKNVDDFYNGTIKKPLLNVSDVNSDNYIINSRYNNLAKSLYVGKLGSTDGKEAYLPSITIKLTPELKEYAQSGISLYTSLPVAVGTGAITAQQILGTEEDIIEQEEDVL